MSDSFTISFIICSYNRASYLHDTLASLFRNAQEHHQAFEIIIIDNNSTDETEAMVRRFIQEHPRFTIRYFQEQKQGLSHARNRGIEEAKAPNLVFLDDDIQASSTLIPAWLLFFKEHPDAVAGGGKIHVQFDDPRPPWMSHFLMPLLGQHDLGDAIKKYPKNKYPFGGNMGFPKHIFDAFGLFNTELGRKGTQLKASEEKELFRRIRQQRGDIYYLPQAFLYHRVSHARLTVGYIKKQAMGLGQSIALQLNEASAGVQFQKIFVELSKWIVSLFLYAGYTLGLQYPKAKMLLKFRWWIWKGYRSVKNL